MSIAIEQTPAYLARPQPAAITYGSVAYDNADDSFVVNAHPAALELAKRLFPGWVPVKGELKLKAGRRAIGDLNLLLQRYPMKIQCEDHYERHRLSAVEHAVRRNTNALAAPITPPASFMGKLISDYQPEGAGFPVRNERCLLADDMGLGKTIQALAALSAANAFPALIVATPNLTLQWMRQAGAMLQLPGGSMYGGDAANGRNICRILFGQAPKDGPRRPIVICHYLLLKYWRKWLVNYGFKSVVFDEVQELRHTGTDKYSAASEIAGTTKFAWGLSGTPIYNYGIEIWSILNVLDFHCLGSQEAFSREWCIGYGEKVVKDPAVLGDFLRTEGLMLRRRKQDVQSQLPPKRRIVTAIEKDGDLFKKFVEKAIRLAKGYEHIKEFTLKGQARREIDQAVRQATGVAKAPYVSAFVKTLIEAGEKVLVFAHHHAVHDRLMADLKEFKPVIVTGQQSQGEKERAIKSFGEGDSNVVLLSLRSAAGIDGLQGRGTCAVFAELDWSPAVHSQCEDRLCRIGSTVTDSILCYYLVSDSGSDEVMQEALGLKIGQFVGLMGDKGETEADRGEAIKSAERHIDKIIAKLRKL